MKHPGRALLAAGLLALSATGCLAVRYQYIGHTAGNSGTYFKLPARWRLYSQDDLLRAAGVKLDPATLSQVRAESWSVAFDGSAAPAVSDILSAAAGAPTGVARVRSLTASESAGYSVGALRSELLPDDPLSAQSTTHSYNVLAMSNLSEPGGLRGLRLLVDMTTKQGVLRFDQVALLDADTQHVFVLGVGCAERCYQRNGSLIDQIVGSWTVKEH